MITQQECKIILEMLASGKITADEADRLFTAIELCAATEQRASQEVNVVSGWTSMRAWTDQIRDELYSEVQSQLSVALGKAKASFVYLP